MKRKKGTESPFATNICMNSLDWLDNFDLGVPPCCPAALPVLPDFHLSKQTVQQPKQNQPIQVTNQSCHPVQGYRASVGPTFCWHHCWKLPLSVWAATAQWLAGHFKNVSTKDCPREDRSLCAMRIDGLEVARHSTDFTDCFPTALYLSLAPGGVKQITRKRGSRIIIELKLDTLPTYIYT